MSKVKMYSNIDINSVCTPFLNKIAYESDFNKEKLYPLVDMYNDTFVTDILFCIFCQYSAVDSECWTTYADKYLQTEYNGKAVDFKEKYKGIYKINKEFGIDPYDVWIKRCWEMNKNPWLTIRMNDCHKNEFLKPSFYLEAEKNGWILGERNSNFRACYDYFRECYDYKVEQVREKMLQYIDEQIMKYDVYGIELDFMREIYCFDYLGGDMQECVEIMNDFIRKVKEIVKKAEEKHGHTIKIAVRLIRDIDQALRLGFDARRWAKENLVDVIIPSSRWSNNDSGIPVDVWKKELPGVEIPGCLETLLCSKYSGLAYMTAETARGLAANLLSVGADGIYLYNYFGEKVGLERDKEVHRTCGTIEEIYKHKTRCVMLGQDFETCPEGEKLWMPLPIELASGEEGSLLFRTGTIPNDKSVRIVLGFTKGSAEDVDILVNEKLYKDFAECEMAEPKNCAAPETVCYTITIEVSAEKVYDVKVKAKDKDVNIVWAELVVE